MTLFVQIAKRRLIAGPPVSQRRPGLSSLGRDREYQNPFHADVMIRSYEELRPVDHRAVIAWERFMREIDEAEPSTVRRRLSDHVSCPVRKFGLRGQKPLGLQETAIERGGQGWQGFLD